MSLLFLASAEVFRRRRGNSPFLGEVLASDFITGNALAAAIGLTAGTSINSNEPWLKFKDPVDGKTKYVSKKPIRHTLAWATLNALGAALGTKQITIGGDTFKVRLFKALPDGVNSADPGGWDIAATQGSEWNRLMYHISGKPFANASNTLQSEGIEEGDWAQYSEADLVSNMTDGPGARCFCQEQGTSFPNNRYTRGGYGVSHAGSVAFNFAGNTSYGWRPVLELIE